MKCEKVIHRTAQNGISAFAENVKCNKEAAMIAEDGRHLCWHHFNKWFLKVYKVKYADFIKQ